MKRTGNPIPSGRLYDLVTEQWPRIAGGVVALGALTGWVLEAVTVSRGIEVYVFAWGATTGAMWFLFDRAEDALSPETRERVVDWVRTTDFQEGLRSTPKQFAVAFDRVFGERHLSWKCFKRSSLASAGSFALLWIVLWRSLFFEVLVFALPIVVLLRLAGRRKTAAGRWATRAATVLWLVAWLFWKATFTLISVEHIYLVLLVPLACALFWNLPVDYLSLLETRLAIRWMERRGRIVLILVLDFFATMLLWLLPILAMAAIWAWREQASLPELEVQARLWVERFRAAVPFLGTAFALRWRETPFEVLIPLPFVISFLTSFFTSVWLWLYILAWGLSRVLVRMSDGVGFLLRVTDVERQPFRSMGFATVIVTTGLFLLGLPLVLL